ncbi:LacI family DNA-binding transcriptional regulator [Leucobacter sp. HY1908]
MASSPVTIVDIARALGISKTAVSSALHGRGRVSEDTKQKVLTQAARMGYVSNRAAQRLRGGKHAAIGLHIPANVRELAFYMELAFGVADVAAMTGNDLLLLTSGASGRARPQIDGLLVVDPEPKAFAAVSSNIGDVPVVTVGEYRGEQEDRIAASIAADHRALTMSVLDQLSQCGVRRPAIAAIEEEWAPMWASEVVAGYRDWCERHGANASILHTQVTPTDAEIIRLLDEVEQRGCDALLWVAQGAVTHALAFQASGVAGEGLTFATMSTEPGPTRVVGVDLEARDYGREAAKLLLKAIDGETDPRESVLHAARIVVPES